MSYVDRILLLSPKIRSFELSCYDFRNVKRLKTWISSLFMHNVENVSLLLDTLDENHEIILSRILLNCTSLRELRLGLRFRLEVSHSICFPNLTSLYLVEVQMENCNSTFTLALSFPLLERLELHRCIWEVIFVEIHAPKLTTLIWRSDADLEYTVNILGTTLTVFDAWGPFPQNFLFTGSTVNFANLGFDSDVGMTEEAGLRVLRLLRQFSNLRKLKLSGNVMEVIAGSGSHVPLPMYNMLRQLKLSGPTWIQYDEDLDDYGIKFLFDLLHAAPSLEYLIIDVGYYRKMNSGDEDRDDSVVVLNDAYEVVEDGYDYDYEAMESIPSCIVSHLKKVKFTGYENRPDQFNLAAFLLKNCSQLKEFHVNHATSWMKISKLLAFPRASRTVRFFINGKRKATGNRKIFY